MKLPTNALGTVTAVVAFLTGLLSSLGCAPGATEFASTCAIPWLPQNWLPYAGMVFGVLVLVGKWVRPGGWIHSFFGGTAVIVPDTDPKSGAGTVTPEQVAQP
jgi:hypothetical protein